MSGRCAAIRTPDEGFRSIDDVQHEKEQVLIDLALRTVKQRRAPMSSSWPARRSPASPTRSAIACRCRWSTASRPPWSMAEGLVRLNPRKATAGTYRRPGRQGLQGPVDSPRRRDRSHP